MRLPGRRNVRGVALLPVLGALALGAASPAVSTRLTSMMHDSGPRPDIGVRAVELAPVALRASIEDRMIVMHLDDSTIARYPVAVGTKKYPTPRGSFTIRKIVWNPAWVPPDEPWARNKTPKPPGHPKNPMKRVKMFFQEPDYYIHGTGDVESLGEAASHGCLRMAPEDVSELARLVMEYGGAAKSDEWYDRAIADKQTRTVYLRRPVRLVVE